MSIADNIDRVEGQIVAACRGANRSRSDVRLMAVSKKHPAVSILEAHAAGLRLFGENRVQEYAGKLPALLAADVLEAQPSANFHCIGPLQMNKAARAASIFDAIDTLDSVRLATKLNQAAQETGKVLPVSIEIKLSHEASKHGVQPQSAELEQLLEHLPDLLHLQARGLMTVPPYVEDPELVRPYFRQLRTLRDSLRSDIPISRSMSFQWVCRMISLSPSKKAPRQFALVQRSSA